MGERDADFAHIAPEGCDAIAEQVGEHHPLRSQIFSHYSRIEANVQNHSKLPSFLSKSSGGVQDIELEWNGSEYTAALTDTNGVLGNYSFSGSGLSFSVSGSTLTITAKTAPEEPVTITAEKKESQRRGIITWSDGHYRPGSAAIQDLVTYAEPVNDPVAGSLRVRVSHGSAKIIKTSEDGMVSGIRFTITGNGVNETVTTGENGEIQIDNLTPGAYTVTELADDRYVPQESKTVRVVSGQTAEVPFHNTLKRGDLIVTKTAEDGLHEGVRFRLSGLSSSGTPVEEYAVTDSTGRAVFSGVPAGQDYTLEELDTAIRYVLPEAQTAAVAWNTVTHQDFTNRLKKWRAEIVKRDGETGSTQGGATLAGAVYGVYRGDDLVDTYETDASGSFTTAEYPCGEDWTVREITPSQGYLLDETVYPVGAEAGNFTLEHNSLSLEVKEAVKKGSITGIKADEQGEPLPGAVFGLFRADCTDFTGENALLTAESAEDGSFSFENIPYGVWQVREIASPEGYVLSDEIFPVQISENGAVIELGNLENKPIIGELELTKKDISDGKLLPGAGFRIKDADGNVVVEGYTDENGIARFTLRYGKYTYEEFDAPEGYRIDTTPHAFEITEDGQIVKAEMTNEKLPTPDVPQTGDESNLGFWINRLDYGKKYCHYSPTMEEAPLQNAIMNAVLKTAQIDPNILQTLKQHIQLGLGAGAGEDKSVEIQIRIAQIDQEFKNLLNSVTAENQQELLTDPRITDLMTEKRQLEKELAEYTAAEQHRQNTASRLDNIFTILDGMKNHPLTYDDAVIRQILQCVIVESKEKIKVVFIGGMEVEAEVEQ